jgi:hypothetical protein
LPQTALTAVEINPDVIALREQFRIPSDDDIRTVFGQDVVALRGKQEDNVVVFAFKKRAPLPEWERLERTALELKRQLGLDFPRYARRMALQCRGWERSNLGHLK